MTAPLAGIVAVALVLIVRAVVRARRRGRRRLQIHIEWDDGNDDDSD